MEIHHYKFHRITLDPEKCFGKPCIRGLRMPVASILSYLSSGMTIDEILSEWPELEREDIQKTHGYIYQNCPIEAARKELLKNIIVEEGPPGPTHPELYVEYCEKAFGVSREELESTRPLATTVAARNHILWVALTKSWLEGIAAVIIGGEKGGDKSRDNPLYTMSNALHNRYGISWEALRFFTVHVELEQGEKAEEHGEIGPPAHAVRDHCRYPGGGANRFSCGTNGSDL